MSVNDAEPATRPTRVRIDGGSAVAAPRRRDGATWLGLGTAGLLLAGAMAIGGSLAAYADLPAFLMVFGGTAAVTTISFPLQDIIRLPHVFSTALFRTAPEPREHAERLLELAETAKRTGMFSLEDARIGADAFLGKAIALIVDNEPPAELERALKTEALAVQARHRAAADILRRGGEVAPAMGLIGTLVGLVQMLANLNTPSAIGPSMAVAILATLYGAVLANMVLLPFAAKLDRNNATESLIAALTIMAAVSIANQESPRRLEGTLNSVLPPAARFGDLDS